MPKFERDRSTLIPDHAEVLATLRHIERQILRQYPEFEPTLVYTKAIKLIEEAYGTE